VRIVVVHIPPFMEYWERSTWESGERNWGDFIRKRYVSLFETHNVHLVISGHQHNYERGKRNGIYYTVIGGAGGNLESEKVFDWGFYSTALNVHHFVIIDIYHDVLLWKAYDINNQQIDEFSIDI
jgi:hypothetical protein